MRRASDVSGIVVRLATRAEKPVLAAMLSAYLAELGQYGEVDAGYPYFDAYWQEPESRWPYLVTLDGEPCGFALVNRWSVSGLGMDFSVAEFYVAPDARRGGVGCEAAGRVLSARPGLWELGVLAGNEPALTFWPRAIAQTGAGAPERIEKQDEVIFRFRILPSRP